MLYVKAEARGKGSNEEFWFNEAWLLSGFDFDNFICLLKDGVILVDIRIGQYPDGRSHDHGTGFRVFPDKLDLCFSHRERIC
ncbi:MAG: MvaI/BcnI family restriction endonuclease [bacterium]